MDPRDEAERKRMLMQQEYALEQHRKALRWQWPSDHCDPISREDSDAMLADCLKRKS